MVLGALDGVKEPVSIIGNALQNIVDPKNRSDMRTLVLHVPRRSDALVTRVSDSPVRLPRVLDQEDLKQ